MHTNSYLCILFKFFFVFWFKLNFSALYLCFVFICRRQRRCRRHIRTFVRWYLLCRYVACFRFFYLCLLERCQHSHSLARAKKKSDTEMCRHTHTHRHRRTGTRSFCCSCRLSSGFIWSSVLPCSVKLLRQALALALSLSPALVSSFDTFFMHTHTEAAC